MTKSMFQVMVSKRAYRLAKRHIEETINGFFDSDRFQREVANSYWRKKSVDMSFDDGYSSAWWELGRRDAERGICRAVEFKSHGYNRGWHSKISLLHLNGWSHSSLDKEYERMEKMYWANIPSGKSNEYYERA